MNKQKITVAELKRNLDQIVKQKISRAWKGYGSALFLELGDLHDELAWQKGGKPIPSPTGDWTLSAEGTWKLSRDSKVLLDTKNATDSHLKKIVLGFEGLKVKGTDINDQLTSLKLLLSNNEILELNKAEYGFFTLLSNEKPYISVKDQ